MTYQTFLQDDQTYIAIAMLDDGTLVACDTGMTARAALGNVMWQIKQFGVLRAI